MFRATWISTTLAALFAVTLVAGTAFTAALFMTPTPF